MTKGEQALQDLMPHREKVNVPDVEHPTLCYKQKLRPPGAMTRCTFDKGHEGLHSWETP